MTRDEIIREIEDFCRKTDLQPATVTSRAVGNSRLYARLKCRGSCTIDVADRLLTWMRDYEKPAAKDATQPPNSLPGAA